MDIVEKLRARKEFFRNGATWCMSTEPDADCAKAADEIERLRAYAERLIVRLDRAPEETRAIDADIASRRQEG